MLYCGQSCQKIHWKDHKVECQKTKAIKPNSDDTPKAKMIFMGAPWAPPGMCREGLDLTLSTQPGEFFWS